METVEDRPVGVDLLGLGTVGAGVAKLLLDHPGRLSERSGRQIVLAAVLVKNPDKKRNVDVPPGLFANSLAEILANPNVDIVVELVGGCDWALDAIQQSFAAGKDIVTANKAVLAQHGTAIFTTARKFQRCLAFEGSVGGGIPILGAMLGGLSANRTVAIQGILNGTSNYILSRMCEEGLSYDSALEAAQGLGYAEANPALDVDGTDAAHKLMVLVQLGFRRTVDLEDIPRQGIDKIESLDIHYAKELGYTIKLLAESWSTEDGLALHVAPVLLKKATPLAQVRGAYNAIRVVGDAVGDTLFYGLGAGAMPTASAVVGDLVTLTTSREAARHQVRRLWRTDQGNPKLLPPGKINSRFYLRLLVSDRPGVMAEVAGVLARHGVSIASVIQHEISDRQDGSSVHMVIMTHTARTCDFELACKHLNELACVARPPVRYPVGE